MTLHIAQKNGPASHPWTVHITDGPAADARAGTPHAGHGHTITDREADWLRTALDTSDWRP